MRKVSFVVKYKLKNKNEFSYIVFDKKKQIKDFLLNDNIFWSEVYKVKDFIILND